MLTTIVNIVLYKEIFFELSYNVFFDIRLSLSYTSVSTNTRSHLNPFWVSPRFKVFLNISIILKMLSILRETEAVFTTDMHQERNHFGLVVMHQSHLLRFWVPPTTSHLPLWGLLKILKMPKKSLSKNHDKWTLSKIVRF